MKYSNFLLSIVFVMTSLLFPVNSHAQDGSPDGDTPNGETPQGMWTKTGPGTQIAIGVVESLIIGGAQLLQNEEFKTLSKEYKSANRIEEKSRKKYKTKDDELKLKERELSEVRANQKTAQDELKNLEKTFETRTEELAAANRLITTSEKTIRENAILTKLSQLSVKAHANFHGHFDSADEIIYKGLTTDEEKAEYRALQKENNEIQTMPDLDREGRQELIRKAEERLETARNSRNLTRQNIINLQTQVQVKSEEVEALNPEAIAMKTALEKEAGETRTAKTAMDMFVKKNKLKVYAFRAFRWGPTIIVGVDLAPRLIEWWVLSKDPGITPWGAVFVKLTQ